MKVDEWKKYGEEIKIMVNIKNEGEYMGEEYYKEGGVKEVVKKLMGKGIINEEEIKVNGKKIGEN